MPLVHIEHTVSRGSLRQWIFRLLPDLQGQRVRLEVLALKAAVEFFFCCFFLVCLLLFWSEGPEEQTERSCPSPQVLKLTLRSHPGFLCAVTPRRAGRRESATSDRTFSRFLPVCWRWILTSTVWLMLNDSAAVVVKGEKSSSWTQRRFPRISPSLRTSPRLCLPLSLSLSRLWIKCFDAPPASFSSYSALLFPVCQLYSPLTKPSSGDVLHKEAHKNISLTPQSMFRKKYTHRHTQNVQNVHVFHMYFESALVIYYL